MTDLTKSPSTPNNTGIGGTVHKYLWNWHRQQLTVVYETLGEGTPVLLLPAFSTVSSRSEMGGIAELLSSQFRVVALDWLGFGQSDRPPLDYQPAIYHQLLQDFVKSVFNTPIIVIAAGHAAGYALQLPQEQPDVCSKIVLVAPTWRGPLPTMGASEQVAGMVRQLVRSPIIGQTLYQLNTTPSFLRFMYRQHVYTDRTKLTSEFITQKRQLTQQPGARFASAAFVTGAIDPVRDRADFLAYLQPPPVPILVIIAEQAPPSSRAEMDAMAELTGVQTAILPGTLGMHEEYPAAIVKAILEFL
ncbi:MAG: alpha/beta fold hydrolase [Xenococcaceae cyanobacterium]